MVFQYISNKNLMNIVSAQILTCAIITFSVFNHEFDKVHYGTYGQLY